MTIFDEAYRTILTDIMTNGTEELNQRTNHRVKSIAGICVRVDDANFPLLTLRKIPLKVFIAEQIWFLTGSRRPGDFLSKYTHIWDEFININGTISTAYGYRWRYHFGRDQIKLLIRMLEQDPSSRHGVVITWDQASDGLVGSAKKKNVPCPFCFTVNIIGGKLNLSNIVRSNDMILGFPHDVAGFALLQRILAAHLGVDVGVYSHFVSHAHVYDIHYDAARTLIERQGQEQDIQLVGGSDWFTRAEQGDDNLVGEIFTNLVTQYHPEPALEKMLIVV